jgi:nucleotide-binding universal stress UspA family protein
MRHRPLVVGVDGSAESASALAEAVHLAEEHAGEGGLDLVVVFVRQVSWAAMSVDAGAGVNSALDDVEAGVRRLAEDALWGRNLSWRLEVRTGDPAHELARAAEAYGAQMIVVGGHRHGAVGAALTRAVNSELVHCFGGSLLLVRPARTDGDEADGVGVGRTAAG